MGDEVRITYETLFDLLRREKGREDLQKLESSFFADVEAYLTEKHSIASGPNESFFSDEERQKTLLQLSNSARLLRELYDRREKKVATMAIIRARTPTALLDLSAMLEPEKVLFQQLIDILTKQRKEQLDHLLTIGGLSAPRMPPPQAPEPQPLKTVDQPSIAVEFLAEVPKFVGKSLEIYGPYVSGQRAMLPAEIARILIDKGRAKEAAPLPTEDEEMDLGEAAE